MVVRVVKLSLIHKIAVLPRGGQEWFLARGLLSRLETRRKLIFFVPPRYRDPWTVRANRMSTGGKGKFGKLLLDRRSVFRLLFFHGYRLRPPRKHFGTSSFSYGFSSIEEDKRKGGIRVETIIELEPYLWGEYCRSWRAKRRGETVSFGNKVNRVPWGKRAPLLAYRFLIQFRSRTFLLVSLPSSVRYQKYRML